MKYRKKPVVIEAVLWDGKDLPLSLCPMWLADAVLGGKVKRIGNEVKIKTLEGEMIAREGDYIIRGIQGEIYPCKPDIFEKTYQPAESIEEQPGEITELKKQFKESLLLYQNMCNQITKDQQEIERLKGIMKVVFYATMPAASEDRILEEWGKFIERNNL